MVSIQIDMLAMFVLNSNSSLATYVSYILVGNRRCGCKIHAQYHNAFCPTLSTDGFDAVDDDDLAELDMNGVIAKYHSQSPRCWICRSTVQDADEPLVRDCSCHGGSGYAHLSCLVTYAEGKCFDWSCSTLEEPWKTCSICKEVYQNQLARDMDTAFENFVGNEQNPHETGRTLGKNR